MIRQWTMTGFATDPGVFALGLDFGLIGMAGLANLSPREFDGPGTNVAHRRRPEMSVLTKILRNHQMANQQECSDSQDQDDGYTK